MSPNENEPTPFEQRARKLLEESVASIDARTRSRLNRARQTALAELAAPEPFFSRGRGWMPVGAAAAVTLAIVGLFAWHPQGQRPVISETSQTAFEDIELLADGEGLELMEDDGAFYEWATAESGGSGETSS